MSPLPELDESTEPTSLTHPDCPGTEGTLMPSDNRKAGSRFVLIVIVMLIVTGAGVGVYLWVNWDTIILFRDMKREGNPIWKDLASGKIQEGDDLEEVLREHTPTTMRNRTVGSTDLVTISFVKGKSGGSPVGSGYLWCPVVFVKARDGRLVHAMMACDHREHTFFGPSGEAMAELLAEGVLTYFMEQLGRSGLDRSWGRYDNVTGSSDNTTPAGGRTTLRRHHGE